MNAVLFFLGFASTSLALTNYKQQPTTNTKGDCKEQAEEETFFLFKNHTRNASCCCSRTYLPKPKLSTSSCSSLTLTIRKTRQRTTTVLHTTSTKNYFSFLSLPTTLPLSLSPFYLSATSLFPFFFFFSFPNQILSVVFPLQLFFYELVAIFYGKEIRAISEE